MMPSPMSSTLDPMVQLAVEQFLYEEADLLDRRQFRAWLGLLAEDVRYRVPSVLNLGVRERADELLGGEQLAHYDDDLASVTMRVRRLETNMAWSEDPPPRTSRFVTNVRVVPSDREPGAFVVRSNLFLYQNRLEREVNTFSAAREDVLRQHGDSFRIAERTVRLDQAVVLAKSLSVFL